MNTKGRSNIEKRWTRTVHRNKFPKQGPKSKHVCSCRFGLSYWFHNDMLPCCLTSFVVRGLNESVLSCQHEWHRVSQCNTPFLGALMNLGSKHFLFANPTNTEFHYPHACRTTSDIAPPYRPNPYLLKTIEGRPTLDFQQPCQKDCNDLSRQSSSYSFSNTLLRSK